MSENIESSSTETLWHGLCEVLDILSRQGEPDTGNNDFMFWYRFYKEISAEIDKRMLIDYMEG